VTNCPETNVLAIALKAIVRLDQDHNAEYVDEESMSKSIEQVLTEDKNTEAL
jgi:hypothetical protein